MAPSINIGLVEKYGLAPLLSGRPGKSFPKSELVYCLEGCKGNASKFFQHFETQQNNLSITC
jgi:hypothetical protein